MFETAELGRTVSKADFDAQEQQLHAQLLTLQRRLRDLRVPVTIVVSGVEGAGKGGVVNRLNTWFDSRGVRTNAFWELSDEERERPRYWRFWRALPERGSIGLMLGSWYTQPIVEHAFERSDLDKFEHELHRIVEFEQLLVEDGALIIKLWFHLSKEEQDRRVAQDLEENIASPQLTEFAKQYERFVTVSERAIRHTDVSTSPWHIVEATDPNYQHLTVATILIDMMTRHCESLEQAALNGSGAGAIDNADSNHQKTILDTLILEKSSNHKDYELELHELQNRLRRLTWQAKKERRDTVLVFEGWDAAGKGGTIRRLVAGIDARLVRVISIAAPSDEEQAHHYLWRFWRHLPRPGYVTIYDRSWYGRVLVERVEGLTPRRDWQRGYQEINDFEEQLTDHGIVLKKFWLHISAEEQLRRFKEREEIEWKHYKITDEDWRNREKWQHYESAVHDMVARTSTANAPWTLVPANDKKLARLMVIRTVCEALESALAKPD
jgi:polyphosphate:AMP phosphotransferase